MIIGEDDTSADESKAMVLWKTDPIVEHSNPTYLNLGIALNNVQAYMPRELMPQWHVAGDQLEHALVRLFQMESLQLPRVTSVTTLNASSDLYENPHGEEMGVLGYMTLDEVMHYHSTEPILRDDKSEDEEDNRPFDLMAVDGPPGVQRAHPSTDKDTFCYAVPRKNRQTNSEGPPQPKTKHDRPEYADTTVKYTVRQWKGHNLADVFSFELPCQWDHNVDMPDAPEEVYIDIIITDMYFSPRVIYFLNKRTADGSDINDRPAKRAKLDPLPQPVVFRPPRPPLRPAPPAPSIQHTLIAPPAQLALSLPPPAQPAQQT